MLPSEPTCLVWIKSRWLNCNQATNASDQHYIVWFINGSHSNTVSSSNWIVLGWVMNDELEGTWKEVFITCFKVLSWHWSGVQSVQSLFWLRLESGIRQKCSCLSQLAWWNWTVKSSGHKTSIHRFTNGVTKWMTSRQRYVNLHCYSDLTPMSTVLLE
jgi:hypothetical protein